MDWKAAEEETKRQFAEAKAAGRRILSYEEWDEERKAKNEKMRQEALRKSWLDREIALRALQQERGATREAVLRSTTTSAAGPLTDDEWVQMQEMMKRLPPAPEKPKKDEEQPQDKRAKTVQKDPKHGMQPPPATSGVCWSLERWMLSWLSLARGATRSTWTTWTPRATRFLAWMWRATTTSTSRWTSSCSSRTTRASTSATKHVAGSWAGAVPDTRRVGRGNAVAEQMARWT